MPQQNFPTVNGQKHSYADIVTSLGDVKHRGISAVGYNTERTATDVHGQGPNRAGVALGKVKNDGSMEMYRADADAFLQTLGQGYSAVPFQIIVVYRAVIGAPLVRDTLNGVRITKVEHSPQEGDEPMKTKFTLNIGEVLLNGLSIA